MRNIFKDVIKSPNKIAFGLNSLGLTKWMSDEIYIKWVYKLTFGRKLNLDNPVDFEEKMQWIKLFDRKPEYTKMVDKYEAKKYVSEVLGEQYIIPTLGVWDKFDDIDFDKLPNQFVLKCTHDSGGLAICSDKNTFDYKGAKKKIEKSLKNNFFYRGREWPYKDVKPRIIAEKYLTDGDGQLSDYKVHNFNGEPEMILVSRDRFDKNGLLSDFYDVNWNHLDLIRGGHPNCGYLIERPKQMDEILYLSRKLAKNIPFVRTDFYIVDGQIYFGEITFFPASGFTLFEPYEKDVEYGKLIKLPNK